MVVNARQEHRYSAVCSGGSRGEGDGGVATTRSKSADLAEEYIRREAEFDSIVATRRVYAKSSGELLRRMEAFWLEYVPVPKHNLYSINRPFFADRSLGTASLHAKVRQKNYETSLWVHYTASSIGFYGQGRVHCERRALSRLTGTRCASCVKQKPGFM